MSDDTLKFGKLGEKVVGTYRKVEDAFTETFLEKDDHDGNFKMKTGKIGKVVVESCRDVENTVVGAYKRVENAFVDAFLEKRQSDNAEDAAPEELPEEKNEEAEGNDDHSGKPCADA